MPLGKDQFPKAIREGESELLQQAVCSVTQIRESPNSPISSRLTLLLFRYIVPPNENQTSTAPEKKKILI